RRHWPRTLPAAEGSEVPTTRHCLVCPFPTPFVPAIPSTPPISAPANYGDSLPPFAGRGDKGVRSAGGGVSVSPRLRATAFLRVTVHVGDVRPRHGRIHAPPQLDDRARDIVGDAG